MEGVRPLPSWNSWITCSTGSGAGGRRRIWSCCCSAAAKCSTGWARSCCSARGWASAPTCSRSSSRSLPCESGAGEGLLGGPWGAQLAPHAVPHQLQAEPGHALLLRHRHRPQQRRRQPPAPHLGGEGWGAPDPHGAARSSCAFLNTPRCSLTLSWMPPDHPWLLPNTTRVLPGPLGCSCPHLAASRPLLGSFRPPHECSWNPSGTPFPLNTPRTSLGAPRLPLDAPTPLSSAPRTLWMLPDHSWVLPDTAQVFPDPRDARAHTWLLPDLSWVLSDPALSAPGTLQELSPPLQCFQDSSGCSQTAPGCFQTFLGLSGHPHMLPDPFLGAP